MPVNNVGAKVLKSKSIAQRFTARLDREGILCVSNLHSLSFDRADRYAPIIYGSLRQLRNVVSRLTRLIEFAKVEQLFYLFLECLELGNLELRSHDLFQEVHVGIDVQALTFESFR